MLETHFINDFDEFGLIQNIEIDQALSDKIFEELDKASYSPVVQERFHHYEHVFKIDDPLYPESGDKFVAKFDLCDDRKVSPTFNQFFESVFLPRLKERFPHLRYYLEPNINRIRSGSCFRSHVDAYAGEIGYTFFFSRKWKWDFGGILSFTKGKLIKPVFPHNGLVCIRDESRKPPHFVSLVPEYVDRHYFLIVGWASSENQGDSDVRGLYMDLSK